MKKEELVNIYGGGKLSGTLINAVSKCLNSIIEAGRILGTSVRMMVSGKKC